MRFRCAGIYLPMLTPMLLNRKMSNTASIDILGRLPERIDVSIATLLAPYVGSSLTEATVERVRATVRKHMVPNYVLDWAPFNYLYFSANFLKSHLAGRAAAHLLPKAGLRILDLGCGGGASTIGFIESLLELNHRISQVMALDVSLAQLDVFRSVAYPWLKSRIEGAQLEIVNSEMLNFVNEAGMQFDVVLLSYSLCELGKDARAELRRALLRKFVENGSLVAIVDSDRNHRGVEVEFLGRSVALIPYDTVSFRCPALEGFGIKMPPKFSEAIRSPLFERYVDCWKSHDLDLLGKLFASECTYEINGTRTLNGIDELREYWAQNAARQRNVEVQYSTLSSNMDRLLIQWEASFDRIDTRDRRYLSGVMLLQLTNGKISALREYYSQRRESIREGGYS
jgi:SAM-dependent methyltransferase